MSKTKRRLLFKNKTVIKTVKGIKYELHLNQLIDSKIYFEGCFEPDTSACIEKLLKPSMVCCDVGANIGSHTLPMARIVGEDGIVIAFEPMEWALKN
ncbi:MAG: hypothetical protein JSW07_01120 [bacterium]|nr:MAG: hypothetical protein JSW07_01120 [bacterium]